MFERYNERARRVIFFARYEASKFGSASIETEHLLLGLMREDRHLLQRFLPAATSIEDIRKQFIDRIEPRESIPTSIDLPLSEECIRILAYAAEESDRLMDRFIGTDHLLLGILREDSCSAEKVLTGLGVDIRSVRENLSKTPSLPDEPSREGMLHLRSSHPETPLPAAGVVPDSDTAKRIAEAVWLPKVSGPGARVMALDAELKYGVWIVTGSHTSLVQPTLAAFIQKKDGKILRIHQEKAETES